VYEHYHDAGFEIVGISFDHRRDALERFVRERDLPWPHVYFDEPGSRGWDNPIGKRYGIRSIPHTVLLDREGKVTHVKLRGYALEQAVASQLGLEPRPRAQLQQAQVLTDLQRYTRQIEANPDDPEPYHRRGHSHEQLERWEAAATDFSAAIARKPGDRHLHEVRAAVNVRLGRFEAAAADYEQCRQLLEKGDFNAGAFNSLAWTYVAGPSEIRNAQKALPLAERAVALAPENGSILNTLGVALSRVGRYEEARDTLLRSDELNGDMVADVAFLAICELQLGEVDRAWRSTERLRILMNGSDDQEAWGFTREAADAFAEAATRTPDEPGTHAALATLRWTLDEPDAALRHFDKSLELDPRLGEMHLRRAIVLAELGQPEEAAAAFSTAAGLGVDERRIEEAKRNPYGAIVMIGWPFAIDRAAECESLRVLDRSAGLPLVRQDTREFGPKIASRGRHLFVRARGPGDYVELRVPVSGTGPQQVTLYALRSWDYGIVSILVNGERAAADVDLFNEAGRSVVATGPLDLGVFEPRDGVFTLRVEVVGINPRSAGGKCYFGLDCVVVTDTHD
jgi:tetratricopeptide (TPR) repeat protein